MRRLLDTRYRIIAGFVLVLVLTGIFIVVLDRREIQKLLDNANWRLVPLSLLFVAVSYISMSYGFAIVYRIFGVRLRQVYLLEVGFVSVALNSLVSSAGTAGHSLRYLLMRRQGVPTEDIITPALFHSYLGTLGLAALLPVGLGYILATHQMSQKQSLGVGIAALVVTLLLILGTLLVFVGSIRWSVLGWIAKAWRRVVRRNINSFIQDFDASLERGVTAARSRPAALILTIVSVIMNWAGAIAALWYAFDALNDPIGVGVLITGFMIGLVIGQLSLIPGGLGIQEGSMAGVYALLGVPFEQAVLASVLFRVVYYFVPFILSLLLYWKLFRQPGAAQLEPQ